MSNKQVEIDGIGLVALYKKRGNSNIRLSFTRSGQVRVSLPYWLPYQAGIQFAIARRDWIDKHRPSVGSLLQDQHRIGKAHRIAFVTGDVSKPTVRVQHNQIRISHPAASLPAMPAVQAAAERGALKALKIEAEQLLPQRLNALAKAYGFDYKSVKVKRLSSRWGSCSQAKEITLNLYLMQLPWNLIDYVLVHELVHTEHLNHSAGFWKRFENVLPDAKQRRRQMKQYRTVIEPSL
jgi:predicted metal-dependent hydrolase